MQYSPEQSSAVEISFLPAAAAEGDTVGEVTELVNRVYADAERGLWRDGADRTSAAAVAAVARAGQLRVARVGGRVVGAVQVQELGGGVGEFGMLVASPEHRGAGVGRALVGFAEDWARRRGFATMQLELLVPREWAHPVKEFLRGWYTRLGYRQVRVGRLADAYPALVPQLATECDFLIFEKPL